MASESVFEFRGVDKLMYAEVTKDTKDGYETGPVKWLSPTAEIGRTTESSSEAHYYDNKPMIVISSTGSDEMSLTVAPLDLETYAEITGQQFDSDTGSLIECERTNKYFAIGYRTKGTDGKYRYVWRFKGQFNIPDETSATEDDSTDTNNTELTWTGVSTVYEFEKTGKSAKSIVCDERYGAVDFDAFFDSVQTPDTLEGTGLQRVEHVEAAPNGMTFEDAMYIQLSCSTEGSTIYYTTDGTAPTPSTGTRYTSPFKITESITLRAMAAADGYEDSYVTTWNYTLKS